MATNLNIDTTDKTLNVAQINSAAASLSITDIEQMETENINHETRNVAQLITDRYLAKLFLWIGSWAILLLIFILVIDPYGISPLHESNYLELMSSNLNASTLTG